MSLSFSKLENNRYLLKCNNEVTYPMKSWIREGFNNRNEVSARRNRFLAKIESIIHENLCNEQFGVEELAQKMCIDRTQVYRKLKAITNKSVSQYIREFRLKKALELLRNDDASVAEIAYQVGFGSPTYFNKCFHEYYGFSPGQLRKEDFDDFLKKKSTKKYAFFYLGGITFLVVAVISIWNLFQEYKSADDKIMLDNSVAVFPFDDLSPEGDQEWLANSVADQIINYLAQNKNLKVIGKASSFYFRNNNVSLKEIGNTLHVETILSGSVCKINDRVRIICQLTSVRNNELLWTKKYDRDASDIFNIIDDVTRNIAASLQSEVTAEEEKRFKMAYQPRPEAFEYFAKGIQLHHDFLAKMGDEQRFLEAKEMFLKAYSIDSGYVDAIAALADLYETYALVFEAWDEYLPKRDSIVNRVSTLHQISPFSLYVKGYNEKNLDSAFYYLQKAYDLDPYNEGSVYLVNKLVNLGLFDNSLKLCDKYLERDPLNPTLRDFQVTSLWHLGQFDTLKVQLKKGLDFHKDNYRINLVYWSFLLLVDRDLTKAKKVSDLLNQKDSLRGMDNTSRLFREAINLAAEGKREEALKKSNYWSVYAILGMREEAISKLDLELREFDPLIKNYFYGYLPLKNMAIFDNIREEPQFQEWLKEAKIEYDQRIKKYGHLFDS